MGLFNSSIRERDPIGLPLRAHLTISLLEGSWDLASTVTKTTLIGVLSS